MKFRRAAGLCVVLAMLLMFAGCAKGIPNTKMINGETFVREIEASGLEVTDMLTDEYKDDYYNMYQAESDQMYVQYFYAKDEMTANYLYNNDYNDLSEKITDDCKVDEIMNSTFTKLAVTFSDGRCVVVVRSGCTFMYLESTPEGRSVLELFLERISYT